MHLSVHISTVVFVWNSPHRWVGELQIDFQDVVFLPSLHSFCTTFLKMCGFGFRALGQPHICDKRLVVSNSILPVKHFTLKSHNEQLIIVSANYPEC